MPTGEHAAYETEGVRSWSKREEAAGSVPPPVTEVPAGDGQESVAFALPPVAGLAHGVSLHSTLNADASFSSPLSIPPHTDCSAVPIAA